MAAKPKMDRRGQAKDRESSRVLEQAHGRYSASDARDGSKRAAARRTMRRTPTSNPNKPVGA